jgi:predicted phosphodiesterase
VKKIIFLFFLSILCLPGAAFAFKFAVLGDSQFHNPDVFENMVLEVDMLKPDFVIQVGDMIHGYTFEKEQIRNEWDRFLLQIDPIEAPFYPVPGNHDVGTTPMQEVYCDIWGADKLNYSFNYENSHFIVLDTDYKLSYGVLTGEQLDWLSRDLENNKAKHVFIFMHRPIWRKKSSNWGNFSSLLKKYDNIRGIFAGHTHENCFETVDGFRCFIINSSGNMGYSAPAVGYSFQFLYISVNGDHVTEAIIPAGSIKSGDYVTRKERNRVAPAFIRPSGGQIPDPGQKDLNIVYSFPLKNRTENMNVYQVLWEAPNPAFSVEPREQAVLLGPGRSEDIHVNIKAPSRKYAWYSLPYARIESWYTTLKGESIVLSSRHQLSIPRKSKVRFTENPPYIDGLLDDTAWQKSDIITGFQVNKSGDPADQQSWIRTLFDKKYFYIGVHCSEPHPENLVALSAGPIPFTWGDDDIEIFIDPNHDMKTFYRAFVNSAGTTFNSMPGKGLCDSWYDSAVHKGKDYWAVEYRMPLSELCGDDEITSATIWGFNARRHRQKPERVQSDWVKMRNVPYEPWRFGVLHFDTSEDLKEE